MEIKREVTIKLKPEEASEIIKSYLNQKHPDMDIKNIYFNVTIKYDGYGDHGTNVMNEVRCTGTLKEK